MAEAMKMIVERDDADVNMTLSDFYSISARKCEKIYITISIAFTRLYMRAK